MSDKDEPVWTGSVTDWIAALMVAIGVVVVVLWVVVGSYLFWRWAWELEQ